LENETNLKDIRKEFYGGLLIIEKQAKIKNKLIADQNQLEEGSS